MRWASFTDAVEHLRGMAAHLPPSLKKDYEGIADIVEGSEKFFLPGHGSVVGEKSYDELADLLRLPFPIISVLSELPYTGANGKVGFVPAISIAWEDASEADGFAFIGSVCKYPETQRWEPVTIARVRWVREDGRCGMKLQFADCALTQTLLERISVQRLEAEIHPDLDAVVGLCVLLGMNNVRTAKVFPPEKVNAKRAKKGRLPLWTYHELEIDGERWQPSEGGGNGHGVRSHMRRGHVRRLPDGRRVWVRATLVRGSVPGFVDKSYAISPSLAGLAPARAFAGGERGC